MSNVECALFPLNYRCLKIFLSRKSTIFHPFLPHDAMHSAVIPHYVVWPSVCPSVSDIQVCFSNRLEYFEINFTAE